MLSYTTLQNESITWLFDSSATVREKYQTYLHQDWVTEVQPGIFQFRGSFLEQGHFGNLVTLKTAF